MTMPVAISTLSSPPALRTPKQPQGILRQSSTESSHKKRSSASRTSSSQDSLPQKRQKVQFVSKPQIRVLRDDENEKSVALVTNEIRHALIAHNEGEASADFQELQQCFAVSEDDEDAPSGAHLGKCLTGLASNSNLLTRKSATLVHTVLHMKWLHRDDDFFGKFQKFLTQLVGSQSGYTGAVLKMLIENFAHLSTSSSGVRKTPGMTRQILQDRIHSCVKYVIFMVPSASSMLCNLLSNMFPFVTDTKRAHVEYVQNLLRLATSMPELRSSIFDLVLNRLVNIDVQVQIDFQDLEEDISDDVLLQNRQLEHSSQTQDLDSTEASSLSSSEDDLDDPEAVHIKALRLLVAKMDSMLDQLFAYLNPLLTKSPPEISQQAFNHLLAHLRNSLLRTPTSRHIQFLLFTAAEAEPQYTQQYLDTTLSILTDATRPAVLRVSAAAYTASFTARAHSLPPSTVSYVFHTLAGFLQIYRKQHESTARGPDLRRHAPYYAAVQACLYIFCFRWRDLLADAEELEADETDEDLVDAAQRGELTWEADIKDSLHTAFTGRLNPLKVCAPEIVEEFAGVAHALHFTYIEHIIEANKRVRLLQQVGASSAGGMRETSLTSLSAERYQQLEAYFPFDPYHLPVSKRWVEGTYDEYRGRPDGHLTAAGAQEEVSEIVEQEDEDAEEEELDDESIGTPEDD